MTSREIAEEKFLAIIKDYHENRSREDLKDLMIADEDYIKVLTLEEELKDYPDLSDKLENLIEKNLDETLSNQYIFLRTIKVNLDILSKIPMDTIHYYVIKESI